MNKQEIAKGIAEASGLTEAEAADRLDRVVSDILARLRRGESAPLPGLGKFTSKPGGKIGFRREGGRRRG
jgi:nucleoid DNA-binding protein